MSFSDDHAPSTYTSTNTTSTSTFTKISIDTSNSDANTTGTSATGSTTTDTSSSFSSGSRLSASSSTPTSTHSTSSKNLSNLSSESHTPQAPEPSLSKTLNFEQTYPSHPIGSHSAHQNTAESSSIDTQAINRTRTRSPSTSKSTHHSRSRSRSISFTSHPTKLVLTDTSSSNPTTSVSGEVAVFRQVVVAKEDVKPERGIQNSHEEQDLAHMKHPFAHTTSKLELLPSGSGSRGTIDVEEEARLYDELSRVYEDDTDDFTRSNTPTVLSSSSMAKKLTKARPNASSSSKKANTPSVAQNVLRGRTMSEFGSRSSSSSSSAAAASGRSTNTTSSSNSSATATPTQSVPHPHSHSQVQSNTQTNTRRPSYQTHRRRPSSLPPSIETQSVFSADIYLADNTNGRQSTAAAAAQRPLRPLFAQDVWIDGWSTVGDGGGRLKGKRRDTGGGGGATTLGGIGGGIKKVVQGGGAYVVYDVVIKTREGTEMRVFKRYSEFEELRERLGRVLGPTSSRSLLPQLPPKSALAKFRPAFLEQRRKYLEVFLVGVLLRPEVGGREEVREWVLE